MRKHISAHRILTSGYDAVVCSYVAVQCNVEVMEEHGKSISAVRRSGDRTLVKLSGRSVAAVVSDIFELAGIDFKAAFQDEDYVMKK